jgi:outer membrane lipoprotein LolB
VNGSVVQPLAVTPARRLALGRLGKAAGLFAFGSFISGCATSLRAPGTTSAPGQSPERQWRGRFVLLQPQRQTGRFVLVYTPTGQSYELELLTPIGTTAALLKASPQGASLQTADGQQQQAADLQTLTQQLLGWPVPLEQLPGWIEKASQHPMADANTNASTQPLIIEPPWQVRLEQSKPIRLLVQGPQGLVLRLLLDDPAQG